MMLCLRDRLYLMNVLVCVLIASFQNCAMADVYVFDSDANDVCANNQGRLLSYEDINSSNSQERVMELLHEGESARIAGIPHFFKSIVYYKCFNVTDLPGVKKHSLHNTLALNHCIDECFDDKQSFAGILHTQCFCFGWNILDIINDKSISATECTETRAALFYNNSTQYARNQLIVYSVPTYSDDAIKTPVEAQHTFKQCKFVQKYENTNISMTNAEYVKKSCSYEGAVNGFICFINSPLEKCDKKHERLIKDFCVVDKELSYIEAVAYCMKKGGFLSFQVFQSVVQHLEQKSIYLLNEFTEFQIFEPPKDYTINDSDCVSVRKSVDTLLVEAYRCSIKMPTLCYRETKETSGNEFTYVTGANVTEMMSGIHVDNHTPVSTEFIAKNDSATTAIPTIFGVSAGCVVSLVIILTIIINCLAKRNAKKHVCRPIEGVTVDDDDINLDRYRRDPSGQESDTPYYEHVHSYYINDFNQQNISGIQTVYEQLERHDETNAYMALHSSNIDDATWIDESGYMIMTNKIRE